MRATFTLVYESDAIRVKSYINQHFADAVKTGKPLVVRISNKQEERSDAQNRLYWFWLSELAKATGNDKDDLHYDFKYRFLIGIYMRDDPDFNALGRSVLTLKEEMGESEEFKIIRDFVIKETSTTKANVSQMKEYLDAVYAFALAKYEYQLPIPEDLKWCMR